MIIVNEYVDDTVLGQTDNRETFQQMMSDAKKKMIADK